MHGTIEDSPYEPGHGGCNLEIADTREDTTPNTASTNMLRRNSAARSISGRRPTNIYDWIPSPSLVVHIISR